MMDTKINANFIEKLKNKSVSILILHGENTELRAEYINTVLFSLDLLKNDPFGYVRLDEGELESDQGRLADEAGSMAMFGKVKLIHVKCSAKKALHLLEIVLNLPYSDNIVLFDIETMLEIDHLISNKSQIMAIQCGEDRPVDFYEFIHATLKYNNIRATEDAINLLIHLIGHDRSAIKMEIDKLAAFVGDAIIDVSDVKAVVADASNLLIDEVVAAAFSTHNSDLFSMLDRLALTGADTTQVLTAASRHCLTLHRSKSKGWSSSGQIQGPSWSTEDLRRISRGLNAMILDTRKNAGSAPLTAQHALVVLKLNAERNSKRLKS